MLGANGADGLPSGATVLHFPDVQIRQGAHRARAFAQASAAAIACGAARQRHSPPVLRLAHWLPPPARRRTSACRLVLRMPPSSRNARASTTPRPAAARRVPASCRRPRQLADRSPDPALPPRSVFADPLRRDSAVRVIAACVNPHPVGD
jgi:hypothetical protein